MGGDSHSVTCWPGTRKTAGAALLMLLVVTCAHQSSLKSPSQQDRVKPVASKIADVPFPMSVSPDGRFVTGFFGKAGNLAVRDLASGETRNLTNRQYPELVMASAFSPDGEWIAYSWHNGDDFDDLRVIGVDGRNPKILYSDSRERSVIVKDWSPNGKEVLVTIRREDLRGEIASVAVSDGALQRLAVGVVFEAIPERMDYSTDGRFIAYDIPVSDDPLNHDIYVLARDGARPVALVKHAADDVLLGWSPDGTGILFASNRHGEVDIWSLPVANGSPDGSPQVVQSDVGSLIPLGFSRDGSYYYGVTGCECSVYLAELDSETGRPLGTAQRVARAFRRTGVDWSPDGKRLSYIAPAGGVLADRWVLTVRSLETGKSRDYSVPARVLHQMRPLWSPDGRFILVKGWDSKAYPREVVYSISDETGERATLLDSPSLWHVEMIDWVEWSADGGALFFVGTKGFPQTLRIAVHNLESGEEKNLLEATAPPFVYGLTASPDGRYLAFGVWDTQQQLSALRILPLAGGEAEELAAVALPNAISPPAWTPDSRHMIYQTKEGLWRVSLDGEEPSSLGSLAPLTANQAGISIHPNGQQIAFVAEESQKSEIWVLPEKPVSSHTAAGSSEP